jgi:hypothetical protein
VQGKEKGRAPFGPRAPFIAAGGGGRRRAQQRIPRVENGGGGGGHILAPGVRSGCRCSDSGADRRAPHGLIFFQIFQNQFKLVNSKQMPSIAPRIPKFCIRVYWSILQNVLNCDDFKFPTKIMLKILEQIQYLNLL